MTLKDTQLRYHKRTIRDLVQALEFISKLSHDPVVKRAADMAVHRAKLADSKAMQGDDDDVWPA
jgi:hypothetical protein